MELADIKKAYRKLKSSVYFDKTQMPLRDQIVSYECLIDGRQGEIDNKLEVLFEALNDSSEWNVVQSRILNSINVLIFPKVMSAGKNKQKIVSNASIQPRVQNVQKFIEMDVEGHILGVLWIMLVGYILDSGFYLHSYGNRVRPTLKCKATDSVSSSPYLFEPYFYQYEGWRDGGLKIAQRLMAKDSDVALICLDIKDFYGSVDIPEDEFNSILAREGIRRSEALERLHSFVYEVMSAYSAKSNLSEDSCSLPIGFLPSNILSNWCLESFDKAIVDGLNPAYYGRYVDDILIVEKIEHNSTLGAAARDDSLSADMIMKHCLIDGDKWFGLNDGKNPPLLEELENDEGSYKINECYLISKSDLRLSKKKIRMFYFCEGQSDALLKCFQEEISRNRSEFRFLPEEEFVLEDGDFYKTYSLERNDTINKLRGIDDIAVNKFELSKYLGKSLTVSNLLSNSRDRTFFNNLEKVFSNKTVIEAYTLWERVFDLLLTNQHYDEAAQFAEKVLRAIDKVKLEKGKDIDNWESKIAESLRKVLQSSMSRPLSLVPANEIGTVLGKMKSLLLADKLGFNDVDELCNKVIENKSRYLETQMYNKLLTPVELGGLISQGRNLDLSEVRLYQFAEVLDCVDVEALEKDSNTIALYDASYKYRPTYLSTGDISYMNGLWSLMKVQDAAKYEIDREADLDEQKKIFGSINFPSFQSVRTELQANDNWVKHRKVSSGNLNIDGQTPFAETWGVCAGDKMLERVRVAIANTSLPDKTFENVLKRKLLRTSDRLSSVNRLVNEAIREKADMLVLPEAYLPIEWLLPISKRCAQSNMAMVAGIEHFVLGKLVFNLTATVLPVRVYDAMMPMIYFQAKNHYAPEEKRQIIGYGFQPVEGCTYDLYCWNDVWFPVYCCYELASIADRSLFQTVADAVLAVEWNKDTIYYGSIIESWSRDLHCYAVQANISHYGDSRIVAPRKSEVRDIIRVKGGENDTILIDEIDIAALRDFQLKNYELQKDDGRFKPTPPDFNNRIVRQKIDGSLKSNIFI